ncbi:MAG: right-handed parallel beta-helix repeat-containing protein, partial [Clostridiales bacterium]|nr:right-handed parallel beta-helix repeat-containing protein [Clostridiales bacterium]
MKGNGIKGNGIKQSAVLLLSAALLTSAFGAAATVTAAEADTPTEAAVYVSPNGKDGADGSAQRPLRTIGAAKAKANALKKTRAGDITVYFAAGTYRLTDTAVFSKGDSGGENQKIIYKAAQGAEVSFTGGYDIPSEAFTPVVNPLIKERLYENVRNKVLQVNLRKMGIEDYGAVYRSNTYTKEDPGTAALYVDGFNQTLARWPNNDYAMTGTVITSARGSDGSGGVFQYLENVPDRWKKANEIWLHGFWAWDWYDDSLKVEKLDTQKREFTLAQSTSFGMAKGKRYYAFNLLEEIDAPGEWYLERATGILYFYPPYDLSGAAVQFVSADKEFLRFENCANVIVEGITFENSCFSGIVVNNSENILVRGCTFRNLGGQGVNIKGGKNCGVAGSDFYDLGKGGVFLTGGDRITLTPSGHFVENSYFTRFALSIKTYVPAISLEGCGFRVSNCVIHDGPHSAITTGANDVLIENCEIYDVCKETSDAGAYYTGRDWTRQGGVLRNNVVHDVYGFDGHGAHAFYF